MSHPLPRRVFLTKLAARRWAKHWADLKFCSDAFRREQAAMSALRSLIVVHGEQLDLDAFANNEVPAG